MTLVVGTAGHIDHGKTTLLRALTGIDADRLPEERRRGMTIDVGYAHLATDDGGSIDFVDVPGHDRLVGNMLVGAGEIDAAMLVVAADDGPRAQTLEHLALLDALGISHGLAVVTKVDAVLDERVAEVTADVERLLATTSLAGSPVFPASGVRGDGLDALRAAIIDLRDRVEVHPRPPTLAIDRAFSVKGRGAVVTGTLRGGPLTRDTHLRLLPVEREVRIREIQVHGTRVERVETGGRTALNLGGVETADLARGMVLTADPEVVVTDRMLAAFSAPVADRVRGRVHVHTAAVDGTVGRSGRDALTLDDGRAAGIVRLSEPVALRPRDRFVMRRGASVAPVGGVVLDARPPHGISRRRQTPERVAALARDEPGARLALHGLADGAIAADVVAAAEESMLAAIGDEAPVAAARSTAARAIRRLVAARRDEAGGAAAAVIGRAVTAGRLVRDGDTVRRPGATAKTRDPSLDEAMDRLVAALATAAPPPLGGAARQAACPPDAVRELERTGRIVVLEPGLAYAMSTYRDLTAKALTMAASAPLTPAAFRDATGTSRKYVMAILEDLDRRAILRRTPAGHVPGPKARRHGSMTERVAAVVLAGGRSSRFGRDKLAEPINGRSMLDHVIERLRAVTSEIVVVAAVGAMPDIPADLDLVHDDEPFEGPLAGLAVGLRAVDPGVDRVIVVGGDMPTIVPAVLDRLLASLARREAAVLADDDRERPLPLAVRRSAGIQAADRLLDVGERRLRALLERLDVEVIPPGRWRVDDPDGDTLRDVDLPGDLPG